MCTGALTPVEQKAPSQVPFDLPAPPAGYEYDLRDGVPYLINAGEYVPQEGRAYLSNFGTALAHSYGVVRDAKMGTLRFALKKARVLGDFEQAYQWHKEGKLVRRQGDPGFVWGGPQRADSTELLSIAVKHTDYYVEGD